MVAACTIIVVAMLTGWIAWTRLPGGNAESEDALERAFAVVVCAVFLTGMLGLALAEAGILRPPFLTVALVIVGAALWRLPRRSPSLRRVSIRELAALAGVAGLAFITAAPGSENVLGGRDPGVYANIAGWLAGTGTLRFHVETLAAIDPTSRSAFYSRDVFIPGFYIVDYARGALAPQFFHLLPVYMAVGFWGGGPIGGLLVPPAFGILAEIAVYLFVRRMLGTGAALIATGLLALNLAQIWIVRNPFTEGPTQLGVFVALWSLTHAYRSCGVRWGLLGGVAIGICQLLRIDCALLITALVPAVVFQVAAAKCHSLRAMRVFLWTATLIGGWAMAHGWMYSRPYLLALRWDIGPIWLTNVALLVSAAAAVRYPILVIPLIRRIRARSRQVWMLLAVVICAAFIAGMWIRPTLAPFEVFPGTSTRTYDEETLVRVAWYVSLHGIIAALAGLLLLSRRWLIERQEEWLPFLSLLLTFAAVYVWAQRVHPDHPWAMRRFLTVVVPGMYVSFAAVLIALWHQRPNWRYLTKPAAVVLLLTVLVHHSRMARPFWSHRENRDVLRQLSTFAAAVPVQSVLLFGLPGAEQRVALPLASLWGRQIVGVWRDHRDPDGEVRRRAFEDQVERWLGSGRDVLYLTEGDANPSYLTRKVDWQRVATLGLQRTTFGVNYTGPPVRPISTSTQYYLHRGRRSDDASLFPCAPALVRVSRPLDLKAQGLSPSAGGGRFRWAMPTARLLLPRCDRRQGSRPRALRLQAACRAEAERCSVQVHVDGQQAGFLELSSDFQEHELAVPPRALLEGTGPIELQLSTADRAFRLATIELLATADAPRRSVHHLFGAQHAPADLNLLTEEASAEWGVIHKGFHQAERGFRWTSRRATVIVPLPEGPPKEVRIHFVRNSLPGRPVTVAINGCTLFEAPLPRRDWIATFSVRGCDLTPNRLELVIKSDVMRPRNDTRELGVAVRSIQVR
jgi:hypothetical protein